mmetsp:Transcript_23879/g.21222  ORF Transcript_23879/g.21222 Transcript_23879/m.21222 type:complete len:112 (+) Transcript_23879:458-793(+)
MQEILRRILRSYLRNKPSVTKLIKQRNRETANMQIIPGYNERHKAKRNLTLFVKEKTLNQGNNSSENDSVTLPSRRQQIIEKHLRMKAEQAQSKKKHQDTLNEIIDQFPHS